MKKLLLFLLLLSGSMQIHAQRIESSALRHTMTPQEAKLKYLIGKDFKSTDPPPGEVRNIAEFEPMEGVLITYSGNFGIGYNLISALSEITTVTTVVANESLENMIINSYQSHNVNLDNCNFLIAPSNSYWTRDYGPWYIAYGDDQIGITDFIYNRPRPLDDVIPQHLAEMLGIEWFGMDLVATGGNHMIDGYGTAFSTDLILEENQDMTEAEIDQLMEDYLGISNYYKLNDPTGTYIKHIDCWAKLLDVDKYLIRSVPETHPQYDEIEEVVSYIETLTSAYGTPYQIYRVYTPGDEPYTNSLILNDHVFVPVTGSEWDDEAIESYQEAMPGYTIVPITGSWLSTDALHCRTHGMADRNMMYIRHIPLLGIQDIEPQYNITAYLTAYSGAGVNDESVKVYYRYNDGDWEYTTMTHLSGKEYETNIPGGENGTKIAYYIYAEDNAGKAGKHPFIGAADPHVFYVGEQLFPAISMDDDSIEYTLAQDQSGSYDLSIENTGEANLHIDFTLNNTLYDSVDISVEDSPTNWYSNTYTEFSWKDIPVNESGVAGEVKLLFNWIADNYPEDGSIHLQSPSGTIVQLASGINTGTYELTTGAFAGEEINGEWRLWLEDSYGDGGLSMNTITLRLTSAADMPPDWVSIPVTSANIAPGETYNLPVSFNSNALEEGEYNAHLALHTNDINHTDIILPVTLSVDNSVGIENRLRQDKLSVSNPIAEELQITYTGDDKPAFMIFDMTGKRMLQGRLSARKHISTLSWEKGIYLLKVEGCDAVKLIRK